MSEDLLRLYLTEQKNIIENFPLAQVARTADYILEAYDRNKTVYAFANGGGAGLVGNLVCDLANHPFVGEDKSKPYPEDMRRLRVRNLSLDPSVMTGISNDLGYDQIFARQLQAEVEKDDVVIGISGSGNSKNVLNAFEVAKKYEAKTVLIGRGTGGKAKDMVDTYILIPGKSEYPGQTGPNDNNFHFEDSLVSVSHMITGLLCKKVKDSHDRSNYHRR